MEGQHLVFAAQQQNTATSVYLDPANMLVTEVTHTENQQEKANSYAVPQYLEARAGLEQARKVMHGVSLYCSRIF